jgi:hypothetical protein
MYINTSNVFKYFLGVSCLKDRRLKLKRSIYRSWRRDAVYSKCKAVLFPCLCTVLISLVTLPFDFMSSTFSTFFTYLSNWFCFEKLWMGSGSFLPLTTRAGGGAALCFSQTKNDKGKNDVSFLIVIYTPFCLSCLRSIWNCFKKIWMFVMENFSCCISLV